MGFGNWNFVGDQCFVCKKCGEVLSQDDLIRISGSEEEYWTAKCPKCETSFETETRDCEHCVHYKEYKEGIYACEKWECEYEKREEGEAE